LLNTAFSNWLRQLGEINKETPKQESSETQNIESEHKTALFDIKDYSQRLILKKSDFEGLVRDLYESNSFVFDLETNSLAYMNADSCRLGFFCLVMRSY
jgi:hypothetical protein